MQRRSAASRATLAGPLPCCSQSVRLRRIHARRRRSPRLDRAGAFPSLLLFNSSRSFGRVSSRLTFLLRRGPTPLPHSTFSSSASCTFLVCLALFLIPSNPDSSRPPPASPMPAHSPPHSQILAVISCLAVAARKRCSRLCRIPSPLSLS